MKKTDNKKYIYAAFLIGLALLFILVLFIRRSGNNNIFNSVNDSSQITITNKGNTLKVNRNGKVSLTNQTGTSVVNWSAGKTSAFFKYFEDLYPGLGDSTIAYTIGDKTIISNLNGDDELLTVIIDETQNGGGGNNNNGGGGNGDDDDVTKFFNSPTPGSTATPTPTSTGVATPTPTPGVGENGECLYWRISYCVEYPTPTPTPTPPPQGEGVLPPDCPQNTLTGRTVIGNELCLEEQEQ